LSDHHKDSGGAFVRRPDRGIRARRLAIALVAAAGLVATAGLLTACEVADVGQLAVTWQFNGHADEQGNQPCAALGADRVVIELDGPQRAAEVVACDNVDPDYPLLWLGFVGDLPVEAYGRLLRDVPPGRYDVRILFIDKAGQELLAPEPWTGQVRVQREEVSRIDVDFAVTTGSLKARWRIGGEAPATAICDAADASQIHLAVTESGGGDPVVESTVGCASTSGALLIGLAPGDYDLSGQLLDAEGGPLTEEVVSAGHTVVEADSASVTLDFPWERFLSPPPGNLRFQVTYDDPDTVCSEVPALAQGPLRTRMGLARGGQPVAGVVAYANPAGQPGCAGLSAAQSLDGTTLAPCADDELIACDLPAGSYALSVSALDASDLVCYGATVDLEVTPLAPEEPEAVVLPSSDATACWE